MSTSHTSPRNLAQTAGLTYVTDEDDGIRRIACGRGFRYEYPSGRPVKAEHQLSRIESLAIPPAWERVWICRNEAGHLQATGIDDAGRKQFLYHPQWREAADEAKFERLSEFGKVLPRIRRKVAKRLQKRRLTSDKVLALIVRLLDLTGMRVGHEEYARNGTYGLATLRKKHVALNGKKAEIRFPGKSGQKQAVVIRDSCALRTIRECMSHARGNLFCYEEEDRRHEVDADDVNAFLQEIGEEDFTARIFRTWRASALAAAKLYERRGEEDVAERKSQIVEVTKEIAETLGNTPAVCRQSYLDPRLLAAFEEGRFPRLFEGFRYRKRKWLLGEDQAYRRALQHLK